MAASAATIRQSQLLGRLVLDRATTETLGRVASLWVDPRAARVLGLTVRSGQLPLGSTLRACGWSQVAAIGDDSVLIDGTAADRLQQPEGAFDLIGHELWTDAGNRIGTLVDFELDLVDGRVRRYLFRREAVAEMGYAIDPAAVISGGPKRLLVQAAAAEAAEPVSLAAESWGAALSSVQASVQTTLRQVQEKTKPIAETARSRFVDLAKEARDRAKNLANTARSRATELADTVRDRIGSDAQQPAATRPAGDLPAGRDGVADPVDLDDDPIDAWDEEPPAIDTAARPVDPDSPPVDQ
jgi:sporulation protein YlmC with PRC-barrel domain